MEHIIFLGIIANRSFSLLSRLYRSYDAYARQIKQMKLDI